MTAPFKEAIAIRKLLQDHPRGLSITEIATALHLHRNTAAKYLEMLKLKGEVDRKQIGTAKNYFLVQRMPVSALLAFCRQPAIILNARMEVAMVNAGALALLGCPLEVLYGERTEDLPLPLFHNDDLIARCREAVLGTPAQCILQTPLRKARHTLRIHLIPAVFDTGMDGCAIVIEDETDARAAAEERDAWRERYAALSEDQTEWILRIRPDMTLTFANEAYRRYTGWTGEQLIGSRFLSLVALEGRDAVRAALAGLVPEHPNRSLDLRTIRPDGSLGWERWTFSGIFGQDGAIAGYHAVGRDITDLRHCEEQLEQYHRNLETLIEKRTGEIQEANRTLLRVIAEKDEVERELLFTRFAFDHASDSILLFDQQGRIYRANRTAGELLGYTPEELGEITVQDVNPSITHARWEEMWRDALPGKRERTTSIHRKKDGTIFAVEVSRTFVQFGDRMYFCSIAREQ
jgi:PAS domain S-box-containing protein